MTTTRTSSNPPHQARRVFSRFLVCTGLLLLTVLVASGCGSFDLFYVDVAVVPVVVVNERNEQVQPQALSPEAIREFLKLYPVKGGRIAAIEANKVNGGLVIYQKRWGLFRINAGRPTNAVDSKISVTPQERTHRQPKEVLGQNRERRTETYRQRRNGDTSSELSLWPSENRIPHP